MTNSYDNFFQDMLRDCESASHGGDVQDDQPQWIDAKKEKPKSGLMAWVACPNDWLCQHQVFLAYFDSDEVWRDNTGLCLGRRVNLWQYAVVPECDISC